MELVGYGQIGSWGLELRVGVSLAKKEHTRDAEEDGRGRAKTWTAHSWSPSPAHCDREEGGDRDSAAARLVEGIGILGGGPGGSAWGGPGGGPFLPKLVKRLPRSRGGRGGVGPRSLVCGLPRAVAAARCISSSPPRSAPSIAGSGPQWLRPFSRAPAARISSSGVGSGGNPWLAQPHRR